ncbi:MAG: Holliday junction branch migration protein RuvA [bacterium]
MISYIQGTVLERLSSSMIIIAGGIGYEVLIAPAILAQMPEAVEGSEVSLIIYYYLQIDQNRATPVMIGFNNKAERDFFESFIQVASIGPRTAVKAIAQPVSRIAAAIEAGDTRFLTQLPGIGQQKAREVVAKLQGKMTAYMALDTATQTPGSSPAISSDIAELENEVMLVLQQLGYNRADGLNMIRKAMMLSPVPTNTQEMLEVIFRQQ